MSAAHERDQVCRLASSDPSQALERARRIRDPWYRAQALSWAARHADHSPLPIAALAAAAAAAGKDDYQRSAVRAWEIAALAERGERIQARRALKEALAVARVVSPVSTRVEAMFQLLQAAFAIGREEAEMTHRVLTESCLPGQHWRCRRAANDAARLMSGEAQPRSFFAS
jgi:hypothetical protein